MAIGGTRVRKKSRFDAPTKSAAPLIGTDRDSKVRKMDTLNNLFAKELRPPKVGSVHPCAACGEPDVAKFTGMKGGKGQWKWLKRHTLEDCRDKQGS